MSAAEMTEQQMRELIERNEKLIALAEHDPVAFLRQVAPEFVARREKLEQEFRAARLQHSAIKAQLASGRARLKKLQTRTVIISPAPGAQWHPPTRGKA